MTNPASIILGIEASNPSIGGAGVCVARIDGEKVEILGVSRLDSGTRASDGVMQAVDHACRAGGVEPARIDQIAVSIGPGGYTALRVATTTAKMLAHTLGCPLVGVPTWRVAAWSVRVDDRPALIALAGKGAGASIARLDADGLCTPLGVLDAEGLELDGVRTLVCDAHVPEAIRARCEDAGVRAVPIRLSPQACVSASLRLSACEPTALEPIYAREPDAVTQWRARHGG